MAYAKIVDNKIVEIDAADHDGEAGWKEVPVDDIGHALMYDTVSSSVRAMTDAEKSAEHTCLLYTSPSPRDLSTSRMPSSA